MALVNKENLTRFYEKLKEKMYLKSEVDANINSRVKDVQLNGASIVTDNVANIPFAKNAVYNGNGWVNYYGVVGIKGSGSGMNAIQMGRDNTLIVQASPNDHISKRYPNVSGVITSNNYDYAVKCAMTDGKGEAWTADEQAAARERMGISDYELIVDVPTTETASNFHIKFDSDGNPLALKAVTIDYAGAAGGDTCLIEINNGYLKFIGALTEGRYGSFVGIPLGNDHYCYYFTNNAPDRNQLNPNANQFMAGVKSGTIINDIWFRGTVPAGASIQIYGIRG